MISAGALRNYLEDTRPLTNLVAGDRVAETHDVTFDLSVHNLLVSMEASASLHVLSALEMMAPGRFILARQVTVWMSVPTLVAMMRRNGALSRACFQASGSPIFCGEPLPVAAAQAWVAVAPNSVVENALRPDGGDRDLPAPAADQSAACYPWSRHCRDRQARSIDERRRAHRR